MWLWLWSRARCVSRAACERRHVLQGVLLSQVLHVKHLVGDPSMPFACIRYLSLPKVRAPATSPFQRTRRSWEEERVRPESCPLEEWPCSGNS